MEDNLCSAIIEKYYKSIYAYCYTQLNYSKFSADDCTQEVFMILLNKQHRLDLEDSNIKLWLYRTADNVIRTYKRKNSRTADVDIDELVIPVENDFEVRADDKAEVLLERLNTDERKIIEAYYSSEYGDKSKIAEKFGLTTNQLYKIIYNIKQKLKE